jgi:hypothetical protein
MPSKIRHARLLRRDIEHPLHIMVRLPAVQLTSLPHLRVEPSLIGYAISIPGTDRIVNVGDGTVKGVAGSQNPVSRKGRLSPHGY